MLENHGAKKNDRFGMRDPTKSDDFCLLIKYIHLVGQNVGGGGNEHLGKLMEGIESILSVLSSGEFFWRVSLAVHPVKEGFCMAAILRMAAKTVWVPVKIIDQRYAKPLGQISVLPR